MPTEIEAKFRLTDPNPVRRRLQQLGASTAGRHLEIDRMFDTPDVRLRAADCGLRIRVRQSEGAPAAANVPRLAILTYKGPRAAGDAKIREELETSVASPTRLAEILARLGFREVLVYEKRREIWRLGPCEIAIDELPALGWWLEIEGPDIAAITHVQTQLDLTATPRVLETYVEMAATHGQTDAHGCRRLAFSDPGPGETTRVAMGKPPE